MIPAVVQATYLATQLPRDSAVVAVLGMDIESFHLAISDVTKDADPEWKELLIRAFSLLMRKTITEPPASSSAPAEGPENGS